MGRVVHLGASGSHGCLWQDPLLSTELKRSSPKATLLGFNFWHQHLLGVSPWAPHMISLSPTVPPVRQRPINSTDSLVVVEGALAQCLPRSKAVMNVGYHCHGPELLKGFSSLNSKNQEVQSKSKDRFGSRKYF